MTDVIDDLEAVAHYPNEQTHAELQAARERLGAK